MKVTLAAIGRAKAGPETALLETYLRRLPWKVTLTELDEKRPLAAPERKRREGELLLAATEAAHVRIVLDERGKTLSSEAFAQQIQTWQTQGHSHLAFLIGGADGHDAAVVEQAGLLLSLGAMTWPHLLVRPMLAEQLYRAYTIQSGHPYHRA